MQPGYGKLLGAIAGALLLRGSPLFGALLGLLVGHAFDTGWSRDERDDPWRVLGLAEDASDAEVDLARRRLLARHHPDRLVGMAAASTIERQQAEIRVRAINAAYDRIQSLRKRRS